MRSRAGSGAANPAPAGKVARVLGAALVLAAGFGFVFVADDLDHTGELLGTGSLLVAGVALLAGSIPSPVSAALELRWLAALVLAGALAGAVLDRMVVGVVAGLVAGSFAAVVARSRRPPPRSASGEC